MCGVSLRVKQLTNTLYLTISPDSLLTHARAVMRDLGLRMLPVVSSDNRLVGIIRREEVLILSSTKSNAKVKDVMDVPQLVFKPNEDAIRAIKAMIELDEWYVPVVEELRNRFIGILSLDSFIKNLTTKGVVPKKTSIKEVMSTNVKYVLANDFISKLWRKMVEHRFSGFPVVRSRKDLTVVGIITQYDLLKKGYTRIELEAEGGPRRGARVKEAMTTPAITLKPYDKVSKASLIMIKKDIGRIPIVDDKGWLVGIIDRSDICKAYLE